ncbi:MAG TPA: DUF2795 domain-containing protein [Ktedonobacteraceae bacterium]|jgi:hypothetical protein
MGLDFNQLNQGGVLDRVLSTLPYPLDKDELIAHAQQMGANQQIVGAMKQSLPDETFNSAEDIKKIMRNPQRH